MLVEIRNKPLLVRFGLLLAAIIIYILLFSLFSTLNNNLLIIIGLLPVILLGWLFGRRVGLITSLFLLLAVYLVNSRNDFSGSLFQNGTAIYAGLLFAGSSALFGWLSDLLQKMNKQAQQLQGFQDSLQIEPDEQPHKENDLGFRNTELKTLNQQLKEMVADLEKKVTKRTAELEECQLRYSLAVSSTFTGIWDWNLSTKNAYFSPRWYEILGLEVQDSETDLSTWLDRIHEEDIQQVKKALDFHIDGVTPYLESEHRICHHDGTYRWALVRGIASRDQNGKVTYMAGSLSDITQRKTLEEQLERAALFDPLTGLPNRALFMDRLRQTLERFKRRPDGQFALLVINLDHFRLVNDNYGHAYGDELLISIVKRLTARLRTEDTLARLGGDELALLVEDASSGSEAIMVAERILEEFVEPFQIKDRFIYSDTSIGIKLAVAEPANIDDLLRDASTAMWLAKSAGRGRYEIYNRKMHGLAVERIQLQTDLRRAIKRGEFRVFYQPLIRLDTEAISGFEALVRWQHPEHGLLEPNKFIPLAEESGLIEHIDLIVLKAACLQGVAWHSKFASDSPLSISVNFSGRHFSSTTVVNKIDAILKETGFSTASLILEVTESAMMANTDMANEVISILQERGIRFHMDDFGTGYSSLSYLHRFPFHTLKIDRSFIRDLNDHPENKEIVQAIIALAKNLGMQVIAEGIEHIDDLRSVRSLSCTLGQGYLFSKPISSQEAMDLISANISRGSDG